MAVELYLPRHIIAGENSLIELPNVLNRLSVTSPFILRSKSAFNNELQDRLQQKLATLMINATFYTMPKGEPTTIFMQECLELIRIHGCDSVVAIGGGSTIDLAKAVSAFAVNDQLTLATIPAQNHIQRLPLIAVPTTAGTGSEATKVTVITDHETNIKSNPRHIDLIPDYVILDPLLTLNVPLKITMYTALDALAHAIEAYVSTKATDLTDFYARQAIELITRNIHSVYEQPNNVAMRNNLLMGSFYAGVAFSNASTNLAHATGRSLGTNFSLPHGLSVALLHPFVVDFSFESCRERYEQIAEIIGLQGGEKISDYLHQLNEDFSIWQDAHHIADQAYIQVVDQLTQQALNGNGILTNRQVPNEQEVKQVFHQLYDKLQQFKVLN